MSERQTKRLKHQFGAWKAAHGFQTQPFLWRRLKSLRRRQGRNFDFDCAMRFLVPGAGEVKT